MLRGFKNSNYVEPNYIPDAATDILYMDWMPADGTPTAAGLPAPGSTPTQVANDPGYLSPQDDGSVVDAQGNVVNPPPRTATPIQPTSPPFREPDFVDDLKKTTPADEGFTVDPLKKKFEPYIIGGLVATGVLFLFGFIKFGGAKEDK